eukprot:7062004-Ditylum_brightwellii.AAC.1
MKKNNQHQQKQSGNSKAFQNQSTTTRNYLLARVSAAETAREEARTHPTHAKLDRSWDRWLLVLNRIELRDDPFSTILKQKIYLHSLELSRRQLEEESFQER